MNKRKWKEFKKQTQECYLTMVGVEESRECWDKAYNILKDIITDGREEQKQYALELYELDESTDYEYDVQGWLEDYLDELDMREKPELLLQTIDELIEMFEWKENSSTEMKFRKVVVLGNMMRDQEALEYAEQWMKEEDNNIMAITASVYANLAVHNTERAGELIEKNIKQDTECSEENDILFLAAADYYTVTNNKKEKKRIEQEIKQYEKKLEEEDMCWEDEEDFEWFDDEDLPFN